MEKIAFNSVCIVLMSWSRIESSVVMVTWRERDEFLLAEIEDFRARIWLVRSSAAAIDCERVGREKEDLERLELTIRVRRLSGEPRLSGEVGYVLIRLCLTLTFFAPIALISCLSLLSSSFYPFSKIEFILSGNW